jgi:two-component sensor histidine kinase
MPFDCMTVPSEAHPAQPLHLLEEVSHRVINEYAEAISTLSLAATRSANAHARATLRNAANRLQAHAEAHRALLAPASAGTIALADHLDHVCASMANASLAERGVRLLVETDEVWMDADRCWRVGLIVVELIRNAARHGLGGGPGSIRISVVEAAGHVSCVVSDNGRPPPALRPGRGCRLIDTLARELGGAASWCFTPDGCAATLAFPTAV